MQTHANPSIRGVAMKRYRLSTLMLLVAIAALGLASVAYLVSARREAMRQSRQAVDHALHDEMRFRAQVEAARRRQAEQIPQTEGGEKGSAPKIPP
jgi:hypothetical protein